MINLSAIVYTLDRRSESPLFVQLSKNIRQRIISGQLGANVQLPPSRILASELGLSRSTVTGAYDQLVAEGYIEGRRGSGFYTCPVGKVELNRVNTENAPSKQYLIQPDTTPKVAHPGFPDLRLFPIRQWSRCVSRVARLNPEALVSTSDSFGNIELRRSIASYLFEWRGLRTKPEQILITAGSIDALEICSRTLGSIGQYVGLENPGYQPLRNIVQSLGMKPLWLPTNEHGVEIPKISKTQPQPCMTILTPSHQFPLGGAMSPLRRMEFLQWADQTDSWIIEDDYDSEFRYAGSPIQALAGFDKTGRTIYIGTFSKIFSVGLRLGFLVSPPSLVSQFREALRRFGGKASSASQLPLSRFIESGEFYRHIRRVRRIYGDRRQFLLKLLQRKLGDIVSFQDHAAGMQLLARLPDRLDDQAIATAANNEGAVVNSLSSHFAQGESQSGLLLGFCGFTETEIEFNLSIVEKVIRDAW